MLLRAINASFRGSVYRFVNDLNVALVAFNICQRLWSKSRCKCFQAFDGQLEERILQTDQLKNVSKHLQYRVDHTQN